ncbi:MAG: GNAT family N-acetyltransferase [Burkholderiaceae bacterium]
MPSLDFSTDEFVVKQARREEMPELQIFSEANPEYWLLTHGHPPAADDAIRGFESNPPPDMRYSEHLQFLVRSVPTMKIVGQIDVATDLRATGVYHLGFFMTATNMHGTGFSQRLYRAYEQWAVERGARWLRLGVVQANARAEAFWRNLGYVEVRRQVDYVLGDLSHVLLVMVKPIAGETLRDYLEVVPRDHANPA